MNKNGSLLTLLPEGTCQPAADVRGAWLPAGRTTNGFSVDTRLMLIALDSQSIEWC